MLLEAFYGVVLSLSIIATVILVVESVDYLKRKYYD